MLAHGLWGTGPHGIALATALAVNNKLLSVSDLGVQLLLPV